VRLVRIDARVRGRRLQIPLGAPVAVLTGPTGAGKTTAIRSARWAVTGRLPTDDRPVSKPGDVYPLLAAEDQDVAVTVELADGDRVIVVDNGSRPSIEFVGTDVDVLGLTENVGFNRANNTGLFLAGTGAVLSLNNDIRTTAPGWLQLIRDALQPGVLVGAHLRDDSHTAVDGRTIPYLDGWCLAGMRDDLLAIGGWNEDFEEPAYFGDNELCVRAREAGMELVEVPVTLRHIGNYTSKRMDITGVSTRNRAQYEQAVRELLPAVVPS